MLFTMARLHHIFYSAKRLCFVLVASLFITGALSAQKYDNPVTIPVSYYGSTITSPTSGTLSFGSELGSTVSVTGSGYGTPLNTAMTTGSVIPGKTYNVSVSATGGLAYGMVHFRPVDGCEIYINGNKTNTWNAGKYYTIAVRVVKKNDFTDSLIGKRGGECTSFAEDKPFWYVGLGSLRNGRFAGGVGIRAGSITSPLFTPQSLVYDSVDSSEVTVTRDGSGTITQIAARDVVLNVTVISSTSYKIEACRPPTPTTPFITYTISQYAGGNGIRIDKLEDSINWSTSLEYASSTWTRYDWQRSSVFASGNATTTVVSGNTSTVTYGSGAGSIVKQKNYTTIGSGKELTSVVMGPGVTSAPTTTYSYYTSSAGSGWNGALQSIIEPSGNWALYQYFNGSTDSRAGQIQYIYRPWLDSPSSPSGISGANCVIESYNYAANYDGAYTAPSLKSVTAGGAYIGATTWQYNWSYASANGRSIAQIIEANYSSGSNALSTTSLVYKENDTVTFFRGRNHSVTRPDGTKDSYAYYFGTWNSGTNTFTPGAGEDRLVLRFQGQAAAGIAGAQLTSWTIGSSTWNIDPLYLVGNLSTVSETVIDSNGHTVFTAENVYTSSGIERISGHSFTYNANNLLTKDQDIARTATGASGEVAIFHDYSAGLLNSSTGIDGVTATYGYDNFLKNTTIVTSGSGDYPSRTRSFTYYNSGLKHTGQESNDSPEVTTFTYETTGRVATTSTPKPGGGNLTTTLSYPSLLQITKTYSSNATSTITSFLDGRVKSKSGTAEVPVQISYAVGTGGVVSKTVQTGASPDVSWTEETYDWLGRIILTRTPQVGWSTLASSKVVRNVGTYSLTTGQLTATETRDESNSNAKISPTRMYIYGDLGMLIAEGADVDESGGLADASIDRIFKYSSIFYKDSGGYNGWLRQDVKTVLRTLSNSTDITTISDQRTRFTKFNNGAATGNSRVVSDTLAYDSSGRWYSDIVWADAVGKTRTAYHAEQGVSNQSTKSWTNGYLSSEQSLSGVSKTYKYNTAGLLQSATEGSTGAAELYTYYSGTNSIESASRTTGASTQATTTYTYSWDTTATTMTVTSTDASLNVANTEYNALGLVWRVWGSSAQPTQYTYDGAGRRTTLTTWQSGSFSGSSWPSSPGAGNSVTWTLDPATGASTRKTYPDTNYIDYTYNARGQLKTRTKKGSWVTTYSYFDSSSALTGELSGVTYTGGTFATPNVSFTYTRFGAVGTVTDASGTRTFNYNTDLKPDSESLDATFYSSKILDFTYETGTARATGYSFNGTSTLGQSQTYNAATGRLDTITGTFGSQSWAFSVSYNAGTDIVGSATSGNYSRDIGLASYYDAIDSVTTSWGATTLGSFSAGYGDSRGLQSSLTSGQVGAPAGSWSKALGLGDGTVAAYSYDGKGQLDAAPTPSWVSSAGSESLAARNHGWSYDLAGNRQSEAGVSPTSYTPGVNNQYTAITGTNAESSLAHDADGNMTSDGTWSSYAYDHEDRLVSMSNGSTSMSFVYDYMGRRIRKTVSGSVSSDTKFLWTNWTLVADLNASDGATALRSYVWGPDFSDARGQAGGAGALLAQTTSSGIFYAMPDQHGNIAGYLDSSGSLVAAREYSAFGKTVKSYGSLADYPIAYSSKYTDNETGLVYYGFRYYNAKHGRFINRDPIEEAGGNNLYAMCQNRGVSGWDVLGLDASDETPPPPPPPPPPPTIPENTILVDQRGRQWGYTGTTWVPLFAQQQTPPPVVSLPVQGYSDQGYSGHANIGNSAGYNGFTGYTGGNVRGGNGGIPGGGAFLAGNIVPGAAPNSGSGGNAPPRPDVDGKVTRDEANEWWRNPDPNKGNLRVDVKEVGIRDNEYGIRSFDSQGMLFVQTLFTKPNGDIFGNVVLQLTPDGRARVLDDQYNFEYHQPSGAFDFGTKARNYFTERGHKEAGAGTPYFFEFQGTILIRPGR